MDKILNLLSLTPAEKEAFLAAAPVSPSASPPPEIWTPPTMPGPR